MILMNDRELCHKVRFSFVPDAELVKDFNTYVAKYSANRSEVLRMALRSFLGDKRDFNVGQKEKGEDFDGKND